MSSLLGVSQKCQYALRAIFELSLRHTSETVSTVADVSETQKIPSRFLEQIFSKLRTGKYISSRRGNRGGYILSRDPGTITVGEVIEFIEGDDGLVDCLKKSPKNRHCPVNDTCVFKELWENAQKAVSGVFDTTTFQDLVDKHRKSHAGHDYNI